MVSGFKPPRAVAGHHPCTAAVKTNSLSRILLLPVLLLAILFGFAAISLIARAQEPAIPFDAQTAAAIAEPWVVSMAKDHPWIVTALIVIAGLRAIFKPLTGLIQARVSAANDPAQSSRWNAIRQAWWYECLAWVLDFAASIKLPPPAPRSTIANSRDVRGVPCVVNSAGIWRAAPMFILCLGFLCVGAGCATFNTTQQDERTEPDGTHTAITTRVSARTFATSKSSLTQFKASQTEKSQGAAVGSLTQESSGTNAVRAIEALERIAVGGAKP